MSIIDFSPVLFVITRNEVMKFITAFIVTLKLKDYRQDHFGPSKKHDVDTCKIMKLVIKILFTYIC